MKCLFADALVCVLYVIQPTSPPQCISLSHIPPVLHLADLDANPDDRLFNDCEQWVVGGQDEELSRECIIGNKVFLVSMSVVLDYHLGAWLIMIS